MLDKVLDKDGRIFWMGIAIIWVYLFHLILFGRGDTGGGLPWTAFSYVFDTGFIGVDIFLFLSAYGLCHSFNKNSVVRFYKNRIKRIFPLYIIFLVTLLALYFDGVSLLEKAKIVALQSTGLSVIESFRTNVEWYTPSLIVVYATFPLLYKLMAWLYRKNGILLYATLFIVAIVCNKFGVAIYENFARRFVIIMVGVLTYFYLRDSRNKELLLLYGLLVVFSFVVKDLSVKYSLCLPMALVGLNQLPIPDMLMTAVSFIGKYSFEVYLAQIIATNYFLQGAYITNIYADIAAATLITATLATAFAAAQRLALRSLKPQASPLR